MIKIKIIAIGKDKDRWTTEGQAHFEKLISRYAQVETIHIPSPKLSASLSQGEIKKKESALFFKQLSDNKYIALSDSGERFDSHSFSQKLEKKAELFSGRLTFVIGGAFGLDDELIKNADWVLSLSPLTFSHQLVRLVLLEQLYRAFSISNNTDYHK